MSVEFSDEDMPDVPSDPDAIKAMLEEPSTNYIGNADKKHERNDSFQAMYGQRIANSMNNQGDKILHRDTDATEEEFMNAQNEMGNKKGNEKPTSIDNEPNNKKINENNNVHGAHDETDNKSTENPLSRVATPILDHQETIQPSGQSNELPSFKKHTTLLRGPSGENKALKPSGLSKTVGKLVADNVSEVAVLPSDGFKSKQIVDSRGKVILQELPFNQETHFKCRVFIEVSKDDDVREEVTVWTKKAKTVDEFVQFVKSEWKSGLINKFAVQLFVADEDGDLDDDYPALQHDQILSKTGLTMFYLKITVNEATDRNNIVGRFTVLQQEQDEFVKKHSIVPAEPENTSQGNACRCSIL